LTKKIENLVLILPHHYVVMT